VQHWEHEVVDPTYGVLEDGVARAAGSATASVLTSSDVGPPLRRAPGEAFAVEELRRNAGTQFDPEVVAALCRVLDRGGAGRADEPALAR